MTRRRDKKGIGEKTKIRRLGGNLDINHKENAKISQEREGLKKGMLSGPLC